MKQVDGKCLFSPCLYRKQLNQISLSFMIKHFRGSKYTINAALGESSQSCCVWSSCKQNKGNKTFTSPPAHFQLTFNSGGRVRRGGVSNSADCESAGRKLLSSKHQFNQLFDKINCERRRPANDVKSQTCKVRERISSARNYLLQSSTRLCTAINIQAAGQTFRGDREWVKRRASEGFIVITRIIPARLSKSSGSSCHIRGRWVGACVWERERVSVRCIIIRVGS